VQLFGLDPHWSHLVNLLIHTVNTLLLFMIFHRMTAAPLKSAFVAALFAVHSLHVESVAWVAERKDVLSTLFWMLSTAAYIRYVRRSGFINYLAVLALYFLGLMAKPMLVTLPFVFLLLDYWPLRRFNVHFSTRSGQMEEERSSNLKPKVSPALDMSSGNPGNVLDGSPKISVFAQLLPLLAEKVPLFFLSGVSCVVTFIVQQKAGAVTPFAGFPLGLRIANAFVSYFTYIRKTFWPDDLVVFYPHPISLPIWQVLGAALVFGVMTITLFRAAKRYPSLLVGWLWFVGALAPVIGIVQIGSQGLADRYTYVPLIGLFVMVTWGVPELLEKWRYRRQAIAFSSVLALLALSSLTWIQVGYWRNGAPLFDRALEITGPNEVVCYNRAMAYAGVGLHKQAIRDFSKSIELNPRGIKPYHNRALSYSEIGDFEKAIEDYDRAVTIDSKNAETYIGRGLAYAKLGDHRRAISDYDKAVEIDPRNARAYYDRGVAYGALGFHEKASQDFNKAIELDPGYVKAYFNLGAAYSYLGQEKQAIDNLKKAARLGDKGAKMILEKRGVGW